MLTVLERMTQVHHFILWQLIQGICSSISKNWVTVGHCCCGVVLNGGMFCTALSMLLGVEAENKNEILSKEVNSSAQCTGNLFKTRHNERFGNILQQIECEKNGKFDHCLS